MRASFTSSYLLPGIVLNPILVLHGFNTYASHYIPSAISTVASYSRYKWFEDCGPPGNQIPYFYVHTNDSLCWGYTAVMVALQVLAYIKIVDSREIQKQIRLQIKAESEAAQRNSSRADPESLDFVSKARCLPHQAEVVHGKMTRDEKPGHVSTECNCLSSTSNSTGETTNC